MSRGDTGHIVEGLQRLLEANIKFDSGAGATLSSAHYLQQIAAAGGLAGTTTGESGIQEGLARILTTTSDIAFRTLAIQSSVSGLGTYLAGIHSAVSEAAHRAHAVQTSVSGIAGWLSGINAAVSEVAFRVQAIASSASGLGPWLAGINAAVSEVAFRCQAVASSLSGHMTKLALTQSEVSLMRVDAVATRSIIGGQATCWSSSVTNTINIGAPQALTHWRIRWFGGYHLAGADAEWHLSVDGIRYYTLGLDAQTPHAHVNFGERYLKVPASRTLVLTRASASDAPATINIGYSIHPDSDV